MDVIFELDSPFDPRIKCIGLFLVQVGRLSQLSLVCTEMIELIHALNLLTAALRMQKLRERSCCFH